MLNRHDLESSTPSLTKILKNYIMARNLREGGLRPTIVSEVNKLKRKQIKLSTGRPTPSVPSDCRENVTK